MDFFVDGPQNIQPVFSLAGNSHPGTLVALQTVGDAVDRTQSHRLDADKFPMPLGR